MKTLFKDSPWLFETKFDVVGHHISIAGIAAFVACLLIGLAISSVLQGAFARGLLARMRIDPNLANIITSLLSLLAFLGLLVLGVGFAGIPIPWTARVPGVGLSTEQIMSLVIWVVAAIWLSSAIKNFIL